MHRDGRGGAERFHLSPIVRRVWDIRKPGLSLWTHLAEMHRWNSDQTSAKHKQRCTVFTMRLEKSDLHRFLSGSIRNIIHRPLHPAHHGGSGTITCGAHNSSKSSTSELVRRAPSQNRPTCWRRFLTKFLRVTLWPDFFWKNCCSQIVYSW